MEPERLQSLKNKARRAKVRRAKVFETGPKSETEAQRGKLWALLGQPRPSEMEAFIRFANGYTYERLTRVHWINAISLMTDKVNAYGTFLDLLEMAENPEFIPEPQVGEFKRRLIARAKRAKAEKYSPKPSPPRPPASPDQGRLDLAQAREAQRRAALEALAKSRLR